MDRNTAQIMRGKLEAIFREHGIDGHKIVIGNGSYSDREVTFKVTVRGEGEKSDIEAQAERMARVAGYQMVNAAGDRIVGYKPRSPKYPWIVQLADGKRYKYPESMMAAFKKA